MKLLSPLPGQVSSSPSANRTCGFPRIRLSMRAPCVATATGGPQSFARALYRYSLRCMSRMNPVFTVSDKMSFSCLQFVSTASLRHVGGFPVLGLLRRLRPSSARSPVASVIFQPEFEEARIRFPGSTDVPVSALGADCTPCGFRLPGLAGFPGGWHRDLPDAPDAQPALERRRSTNLSAASPTSESVRSFLTRFLPSVRFPSPWRSRWPGRSRDRKFPHARL